MKKNTFIILAIILPLLTISAQLFAGAKYPQEEKSTKNFASSPAWDKLDLRMKELWQGYLAGGFKKPTIGCIMKTKHMLTQKDKIILDENGFKVQTIIGDIVTGHLQMVNLPKVAGLNFVVALEADVPMTMK